MNEIIAHPWFNLVKPDMESYHNQPVGVDVSPVFVCCFACLQFTYQAIQKIDKEEQLDTDVLHNLKLLGWNDYNELVESLTSDV
jgi:hypothetical protein